MILKGNQSFIIQPVLLLSLLKGEWGGDVIGGGAACAFEIIPTCTPFASASA